MKYLWAEDTGAGFHFWKLVNQLFFDDALVVESKESNQGLLDALAEIDMLHLIMWLIIRIFVTSIVC